MPTPEQMAEMKRRREERVIWGGFSFPILELFAAVFGSLLFVGVLMGVIMFLTPGDEEEGIPVEGERDKDAPSEAKKEK